MELQDLKSKELIDDGYKIVINIGVKSDGNYEFAVEANDEFKQGVFALHAVLPLCMDIIMDRATELSAEYARRLNEKGIKKTKPALDILNSLMIEMGYKK